MCSGSTASARGVLRNVYTRIGWSAPAVRIDAVLLTDDECAPRPRTNIFVQVWSMWSAKSRDSLSWDDRNVPVQSPASIGVLMRRALRTHVLLQPHCSSQK